MILLVRLIYDVKSIFVKVNRFNQKFSDDKNEMENTST